ncbi:unnamed protein product [Hymenolepis diminuta]|uniref:Uncharacterized protein n=1 Tax=Hymenolepis diminuta TaxID=6216 RepID=A0A564Z219_HYMDI|nr:unnamed protein product [Hymenolepis diminuta]
MPKDNHKETTLPSEMVNGNSEEYVHTDYGMGYREKAKSTECPQHIVNRIKSLVDPKDMHEVKKLVQKRLYIVSIERHLQKGQVSQARYVKILPDGTVRTCYSIQICKASGVKCYLDVQRSQSELLSKKKIGRKSTHFKDVVVGRIREFIESCDNIDVLKHTREVILTKIEEFNASCEKLTSRGRSQCSYDSSWNVENNKSRKSLSLHSEAPKEVPKENSLMTDSPSRKTSTPFAKRAKIVPPPTYKSSPSNSPKPINISMESLGAESPEKMINKIRKSLEKWTGYSINQICTPLGNFSEAVPTDKRIPESQIPISPKTTSSVSLEAEITESPGNMIERTRKSLEKYAGYLTGSFSPPLAKCSESLPETHVSESQMPIATPAAESPEKIAENVRKSLGKRARYLISHASSPIGKGSEALPETPINKSWTSISTKISSVPSRSVTPESSENMTKLMEKSPEKVKKLSTTRIDADLGERSESLPQSQAPITSKTVIISSGTVLVQSPQKVIEKLGEDLEKKMEYLTNSVSIPLGRHSGPVFPKTRSPESQATTSGNMNSRLQGSKITDPEEQVVVETKGSVIEKTDRPASKIGVPVEKYTLSVPPSNIFESQLSTKSKNRKKCSEKTGEDPSPLLVCCYVVAFLCFVVFKLLP